MKIIVALLLCSAFVFTAQISHATGGEPNLDMCLEKAFSTSDQIDCLGESYQYWEKQLNQNYKKLMTHYANDKAAAERVKKAQLLWIQYKEATLKAYPDNGGSLDRLAVQSFLESETKKQAQLLKDFLAPSGE